MCDADDGGGECVLQGGVTSNLLRQECIFLYEENCNSMETNTKDVLRWL